jgi:hypothetical protein
MKSGLVQAKAPSGAGPRFSALGAASSAGGRERGLKGPPKQKQSVTPVVGGWVRGQKRTRVRFIFFDIFLSCF